VEIWYPEYHWVKATTVIPYACGFISVNIKKYQHLYRVKTIITAMLTVRSGLENSQNKWLLVMLLIHDDKWWYYNAVQMILFDSNIWSCGLIWELKHNLILLNAKILTY
jgi:hypothetical protein